MGIEVLQLIRRQPGHGQRLCHAAARAVAIFRARGDVIGIGTGAVAHHFGQRHGAARQGVVQSLQHQGARALAHDKAVAARVEGA